MSPLVKPENIRRPVTLSLHPAVISKLDTMAKSENLPRSQVAERVMVERIIEMEGIRDRN